MSRPLLLALALAVALLALRAPLAWDALQSNLVAAHGLPAVGTKPRSLSAWGSCQMGHAAGRALLEASRAAEALPHLQEGVRCEHDRWAWLDLGRAQYALGLEAEAAQSWHEAEAIEFVLLEASKIHQAGSLAEAEALWAVAADVAPTDARPLLRHAAAVQESDPQRAEALLQAAIQRDPTFLEGYRALGTFYERLLKAPERAQPLYAQALQQNPDDVASLRLAAANATQLGAQREAIELWLHLATLSERDRPTAYRQAGQLLIAQGQGAEGLKLLADAVALRPDNVELVRVLAQHYDQSGCWSQAIARYEQLLTLKPGERATKEARERLQALRAAPVAPGTCPLTDEG